MRLDLKNIIHRPGAKREFHFSLDLSHLDFYGRHIIPNPVNVSGAVENHAGALTLLASASSLLSLSCDRCGKEFTRQMDIPISCLLAQELEDDENDEIYLLENGEADLDEIIYTAFILALDTKNLCSDDCKGLCAKCGANLNLEPCSCKKEIDPRLAALAQLLEEES